AIDAGATRLGMGELLEHDDAGATGDDKTVAPLVIGARGGMRPVVVVARHRAHPVEEHGEGPIELLAAAGEDDVLLAVLDDLIGIADAMVRGRAGGRDRIVDALDLE